MVNLHSGTNEGYGTVMRPVFVDGKPGYQVQRDNGEVRDGRAIYEHPMTGSQIVRCPGLPWVATLPNMLPLTI
jgi:hypothetical protein